MEFKSTDAKRHLFLNVLERNSDSFMNVDDQNLTADLHIELQALSDSERMLLDLIWREGPISRKDLARKAGFSDATATRLTRRVSDLKLIEETVLHEGSVGNPSRPLSRATPGAYSVGVSFDRGTIQVGLSDLSGKMVKTSLKSVPTVTLKAIKTCVLETINSGLKSPSARRRVLGVGLTMPGYRAASAGEWAVHWDFPELLRQDVAGELSRLVNLPVYIERDAVAAAIAERIHGVGRDNDNFFYIYLAQGVGGCLMVRGQPLKGSNGNAGGLGVLFPEQGMRPSASHLLTYLHDKGLVLSSLNEINAKDPGTGAMLHDWCLEAAKELSPRLNIVARLFDPAKIIIGGQMPSFILEQIKTCLSFNSIETNYTAELKAPDVITSELTRDALLIGAASLPIAQILRSELET